MGVFYNGQEIGEGGEIENSTIYGATQRKLFPESRKGCLDRNLIQSISLDDTRTKDNDALFLYQLNIPM